MNNNPSDINIQKTAEKALALAQRIAPLLRGNGADVQSGALADLVARFLAGHIVPGSAMRTDHLRHKLLENFVRTVRMLVEINARDLGTHLEGEERAGHG